MDEQTFRALQGSIAKWEAIVAGNGVDEGPDNCPLCKLFHPSVAPDDGRQNCDGCPVKAKTGRSYCAGSPYDEYAEGGTSRAQAKRELKFLQSLLPQEPALAQAQDKHE